MACEIVAVLNRDLPDGFAADMGVQYIEAAYKEGARFCSVEVLALPPVAASVTSIVVLKPQHKTAGLWRQAYACYQRRCVDEGGHLLEIDLLRDGLHTVAAPREALRQEGVSWDYLVSLYRGGRGELWPVSVRSRLPRVRVPLTDGHPDVILNLQACFDRAYEAGPYRRRVDYRREPAPPLSPADADWADALLREKGLR
jgi:hypothetical protein